MLLVEADGDMLLMGEGALLEEGDEPGIGMFIMGEPPRGMLWWIATHQAQTFSCGAPATMPMTWPSSWVQRMGRLAKVYWENGRPSTSGRKPKYELDYGTCLTGMERHMGSKRRG